MRFFEARSLPIAVWLATGTFATEIAAIFDCDVWCSQVSRAPLISVPGTSKHTSCLYSISLLLQDDALHVVATLLRTSAYTAELYGRHLPFVYMSNVYEILLGNVSVTGH